MINFSLTWVFMCPYGLEMRLTVTTLLKFVVMFSRINRIYVGFAILHLLPAQG